MRGVFLVCDYEVGKVRKLVMGETFQAEWWVEITDVTMVRVNALMGGQLVG